MNSIEAIIEKLFPSQDTNKDLLLRYFLDTEQLSSFFGRIPMPQKER
jgi:hypothetical protein